MNPWKPWKCESFLVDCLSLLTLALLLVLIVAIAGCGPANSGHGQPPPPPWTFAVENDYHGPWPGPAHSVPIVVYAPGFPNGIHASVLEGGTVPITFTGGAPAWVFLRTPFWDQTYSLGKDYQLPQIATTLTVPIP